MMAHSAVVDTSLESLFFAELSVLRVDIERSVFVIVRLTIVFPLPIRTNHLALPVNNMKGTITFDITLEGCFHQLSTCWKAMTGPFETSCYGAWMSKLESFHSLPTQQANSVNNDTLF